MARQYTEQIHAFQKIGLLDILPKSGEAGIIGIDNEEYPLPTLEQIKEQLQADRAIYEPKVKQGFAGISLTPLAMPLEALVAILQQRILIHHREGKLLATKVQPTDPDTNLELNTNEPLYTWDGWLDPNAPVGQRGADVTDKCLYHVQSFDQTTPGGHTKKDLLALKTEKDQTSPFAGWQVLLLETNVNIPHEGKGGTSVGGRDRLTANKTPEQYLQLLQTDPQYLNEQGLTIEDWITLFLTHLEKTNQVIDNYGGNGSACYLPGSFNPSSRDLGGASWGRGVRRAGVYGCDPRYRAAGSGLRSAVGVRKRT